MDPVLSEILKDGLYGKHTSNNSSSLEATFVLDNAITQPTTTAITEQYHALRDELCKLMKNVAPGYIWHREPPRFHTHTLANNNSNNKPVKSSRDEEGKEAEENDVLMVLVCVLEFGDCLLDEWLFVYLLLLLTSSNAGVSISVTDEDGQFLLIEAAECLPGWISPENMQQRVWLRRGGVNLISPQQHPLNNNNNNNNNTLTLSTAVSLLLSSSSSSLSKDEQAITEAIRAKLKDFPSHALQANAHACSCQLPGLIAFVLQHRPQWISRLTSSFIERTKEQVDAILSSSSFLPFLSQTELDCQQFSKTVRVTFTQTQFAQLQAARLSAPLTAFPFVRPEETNEQDKHHHAAVLGAQLVLGCEVWYQSLLDIRTRAQQQQQQQQQQQKKKSENDKKEEEKSDDKQQKQLQEKAWEKYKGVLESRGFFTGHAVGSESYAILLAQARMAFSSSSSSSSSYAPRSLHAASQALASGVEANEAGKRAILLLQELEGLVDIYLEDEQHLRAEVGNENVLLPDDDTKWMHVAPDSVDQQLHKYAQQQQQQQQQQPTSTSQELKKATDIVSGLKSFMNAESSILHGVNVQQEQDKLLPVQWIDADMTAIASLVRGAHTQIRTEPEDRLSQSTYQEPPFVAAMRKRVALLDMKQESEEEKNLNDYRHRHTRKQVNIEEEEEEEEEEGEEQKRDNREEEDEAAPLEAYMNAIEQQLIAAGVKQAQVEPESATAHASQATEEDHILLHNVLKSVELEEPGLSGPTSALIQSLGLSLPTPSQEEEDEEETHLY